MTTITSCKSRLRVAAFGFGLALFSTTSPAEAIVITNVEVVIGASSFTAGSVGWLFPVNLLPGQDLVLTQNLQGPPTDTTSYNFDTSDVRGPNIPQIAITADGVTTVFNDIGQVLNVKGIDTNTNFDNEAQNYGLALNGPGYQVFLGYADNTHTGACGAWANSVGLLGSNTCLPAPFSGATFFQGAGGLLPPVLLPDQVLPDHCLAGATCFEAGVIRILAVTQAPEPATVALLLTGMALVTARQYRRTRKRA